MSTLKIQKTGEVLLKGEIDENFLPIKENLIYHYPCDGHAKSIIDHNILDYSTWVIGSTGSQPGFSQNGDGNSIVEYKDPFGNKTAVWQSLNNDTDSNADGGWNTSTFSIDNTKYYRFSTWIRRDVLGNGSYYFGCHGYGSTNGVYDSNNNLTTNPYFKASSWSGPLQLNQWYLLVGFIYPHDYSGDLSILHADAGCYDINGKIFTTGFRNFKWHPSSTAANHRSYLYYSTDPNTHQLWVYPRVDLCDGTEPTIEDLLSGFNRDGSCTNPLELSDTHITYSGIEISRECTNILPSSDINSLPTYGNGWGTYNVNQYNSGNYFNIGTIDNVTNNIVTLSSVDHPIYTYDVLRPQTTGGGVTAGTDYFIKKHSENSFSLHQYNSSQDGSQGYIVDGKGFKVHESIWSDNRISINATNFPTSWWGNAHLPNSALVKEIIPLGYKGIHDCIRCHGEHRFGGYYSDSRNQDYMAYGVKPSVTEGDYYSVSFKIRNVTEVGCGKSFMFELWTSGSNSPVWMLNNFTLPNDTEWHEFVFYGTAPNTGTTNIYFKQPLYSTIDISEIFISKIYDYRSFTKNSKAFSHFKIPVNIDLDTSPFTLIARVNPTNSIEYLIDKGNEVAHSYTWRSLLDFHAGTTSRFDGWWSSSKTALFGVCYPTDTSGSYTCPSTGNHFADTEDDILIGCSFHGGRSFTVFTYRNGDIHYNNHTAGDDLGFLSSISLNGYSNNYLGGHIWKSISLYDTDLSLDDFTKLAQYYFSPQTNGDLIIKDTATIKEKLNNIETNSIYFPLSDNANDENNIFEPINSDNIGYEFNAVFVGTSTTNASLNDGQTTSPWSGDGSPTKNIIDPEITFRGRKVVRFHVGSSNNAYIHGSSDLSTSISDTNWTSACYIKRADGQPMPTQIGAYLYIDNNSNVNSNIYPEYVGDGWYKCVYTREGLGNSGYPTLAGFYNLPNTTDLLFADWQVENKNYSTPFIFRNRNNGHLNYTSITPYIDFEKGTIGCWFRPTKGFLTYNHTRVMGHGTSVNGNIIQIARYGSSQTFVFNISNDSSQPQTSWGTCQTANFTLDEWHFLVARWDVSNNVMDLTMNGVKYSNTLSSTYIPSVKGTFDIGYHAYYTRWSNSYIRDVFISKEYISDTIIDKIYRQKLKISKNNFQCQNIILESENL